MPQKSGLLPVIASISTPLFSSDSDIKSAGHITAETRHLAVHRYTPSDRLLLIKPCTFATQRNELYLEVYANNQAPEKAGMSFVHCAMPPGQGGTVAGPDDPSCIL